MLHRLSVCFFLSVLAVAPTQAQITPNSVAFPDLSTSVNKTASPVNGGSAVVTIQPVLKQPKSMSAFGKLGYWARNSYSPRIFVSGALNAGIPNLPYRPTRPAQPDSTASDQVWMQYEADMEAYGVVMERYRQVTQEELRWRGRRMVAGIAESETRSFAANFLIPMLVRQDPRYFRAEGRSRGYRLAHALSRVVIARSDRGTPMFNFGAVGGTFAAAGAARWYNTQLNVPGLNSNQHFIKSVGFNFAADAFENVLREFWPRRAQK